MYDHTIRQMQHLSTRDHIEPQLQIDPFHGREMDYPPYGYTGHLPPGYDYRYGPPPQWFVMIFVIFEQFIHGCTI